MQSILLWRDCQGILKIVACLRLLSIPFIKSEWIRDGDTQQFLKYLGNLSKEVWTASFVKYKGIEFTSISKNEEI